MFPFVLHTTECIKNKHINSVNGFQNVFKEIQILLDPPRPFKGDYRSLAGKFGMNQNRIQFLGTQISPTEALLNQFDPTLADLCNHLLSTEVDRSDVVKIIKEWMTRHCGCEECNPAQLS